MPLERGSEVSSNETMNIYMIREDGQDKLWKAATMHAALTLAEDDYVREERERNEGGTEQEWREFYRADLLESCTFIGELVNP